MVNLERFLWNQSVPYKIFRTALKEARELNVELKEIVEENAESTHEFTSIISSQREEIENLRKIIADNNYEVRNAVFGNAFNQSQVFQM